MTKKLILLLGPTASGKTGISIDLAKRIGIEKCHVINFDSVLFYNELNIGSAKPDEVEMDGVTHHLVSISPITKELNASDFVELAIIKINELHSKGIVPILVGGSAFYLRSLIRGMYESESTDEAIQQEARDLYEKEGMAPIVAYLKVHDPESLENLHENDHYRRTRAYEYHRMTGKKISDQKKQADDHGAYDFSTNIHGWDTLNICLELPKEEHWEIILKRTKQMLEQGLLKEVEDIMANDDHSPELKALKTIGYKETIQYLNGEITSEEELIEKIYFATRRLAKSQKTFLKKVTPLSRFHPLSQRNDIYNLVEDFILE
ncbi:tRNA (adenosine(37)-N6)-dimethylallyltransferase MiaA [Halobacteriovorax sp. DA5]|uniref:tRNA (adenosine(37)-N6)-dimethylallyltransferase MiaA n=1 Tax=Halobacteriovorax sp. DA5 TaxID=2067553 RepID=UPI000CD2177A|nr:tRNA (adenosine(37)-N6)-dimethylallyltransferase MiaA [Halobacteriovorax sp. DA5]POB14852.1 tRNA (adenosine(37)-N6)-dimethylallyltransferase MiaA [Halobacteriovorax sp. DA5]